MVFSCVVDAVEFLTDIRPLEFVGFAPESTLWAANDALFLMVESLLTEHVCSILDADFSIGLAKRVTYGDFSFFSGDFIFFVLELISFEAFIFPSSFVSDLF